MQKNSNNNLPAVILFGGLFIFYQNRQAEQKPPSVNKADQQANTKQKMGIKIDNQSAVVTVTVSPIDIFSQSIEWKFDIVMDTHSVGIDQDLTKTAVLVDGRGKEYKPLGDGRFARWRALQRRNACFGQIKLRLKLN